MATTIPGFGGKSYLQIGRESTYGSAATAIKKLGFIECSVQPIQGLTFGRTLADSLSRTSITQGALRYECRLLMDFDYHTHLMFLDGVFGTNTYGSNGASTAGSYTHTFTEKKYLNSYTIELCEGNIDSGKVQRLQGAQIRGMTIRGTAGEGAGATCTAEYNIVASTYATAATATSSLTIPTEVPVLTSDASTVSDGTADSWTTGSDSMVIVKEFVLTLTNKLDDQRYHLGNANPLFAFRNDFIDCSLQLKKEFTSDTMLGSHVNSFTAGNPKLVFGSSSTKRMTMEMGTAYITQYNHPIAGYGIIEQNVTWTPIYNVSNASALKMTSETTTATITT